MALNKILSGMVEDFSKKSMFSDLGQSKAYEYLVNYAMISKFHPEAFSDPQDIKSVDVDSSDSMFGLDCIAFIINDNLVLSKSDIKAYARSNNLDVKILFFQTKIEEKYDSGALLKTTNAVKSFFGDRKVLGHNEQMQNAFEIYDELCRYENTRLFNSISPKCFVYFVTAARPCDNKMITDLCASEENAIQLLYPDIKNVEIQVLGGDYIANAYKEVENRIEVHINFKNNLSLDKIDRVEQSYLGYLTGEEFLKIIVDSQGNLRRRLFYENVRDYQGATPVNKEIRTTLTTPLLHDKFILLNNGITIVARHFKPLGSNEFEMTDFQIVNGCQTSNELYRQKGQIEDILIPVKIIHTTDSELISMIVRASNRQTTVPDEAFITMEAYHKSLQDMFETYSKEMPLKLYYERRSGEFDFLDKRPSKFQIVSLHGLIRAVTSVYFANAYVVHNNNPANILRNRNASLFQDAHIPEVYYVSNYLLSQFTYFNYRGEFGSDANRLRFYVPMVVRWLMARNIKIPDFTSKAIKVETANIISILKNDPQQTKDIFVRATEMVRAALTQFQKQNPSMTITNILRSQKFNQMVEQQVAKNIHCS